MADILSFAGFRTREPLDSFDPYKEGTYLSHKRFVCHDWSNQELADLYRVEALLAQANIRIRTTRGVSDEGDPWFVFCYPDGEVFVHLARIDGLYILDGPGLDSVISGPNFAALIDRFANAVAARAPTGNVVQLRIGSTDSVVRLHPSVMLAALVWSLYLASDHLVEPAQAGELSAGDGSIELFPSLMASFDPDAPGIHELADRALGQFGDFAGKAPSADPQRLITREADLSRTGVTADGGAYWNMISSATGIAAGLTAIAVSFGLYDGRLLERPHNDIGIDSTGSSPIVIPVHAMPALQDLVDADKGMPESSDAVAARETVTKVASIDIAPPVIDHAQMSVHPSAEVKVNETTPVETETTDRGLSPQSIEKTLPTVGIGVVETSSSEGTVANKATSSGEAQGQDLQSLVTLATQHLGQVSAYKFDGLSVDATFDVSTLSKQTAQLVLSDLSGPSGGINKEPPGDVNAVAQPNSIPHSDVIAQYLPYDDAAKSFVYQFLLKSNSIEMIKSDNMIVLVDTSAVDDPSDHAFSVSWISDDHSIISTIGHAQDFAGHALA
jgi:hypothetical protein